MTDHPDVRVVIPDGVFNEVYFPYLDCVSRTQIYFGGSSSGKSVFLSQRAVHDVMQGKRNYLICRAVARTIRNSVFNEIKKVINDWGVQELFNINKSDLVITCENGSQIIFVGLDDVEKAKSITPAKGVFTDIWVEESTEVERDTIKQLYKRQRGGSDDVPKRLTMSFNPIVQNHWLYEEYFGNISWADKQTDYKSGELSILKTWYIHNKFLTPDDVKDLESEEDPYYRDVYTFGNWGVLGHVIFTNWSVQDLSGMLNEFTNTRNGLDFGFSSDPAALSRSHYDRAHKTIYVFDELYEKGLTNPELAGLLRPVCGNEIIVCDSAEPKSIRELRDNGINAHPAKKGQDSVNFGIQWLQQQTIVLDTRAINARNELQQYQWQKDKNGNAIRRPVDRNNHWIDATRYAYENDMIERRQASSWQG